MPPREPEANLDGLTLWTEGSNRFPKVGCRETHFKHNLLLSGAVKNTAWFQVTPKSEFASAYLKR